MDNKRYTTHSPFVHDYNPLTHLRQYNPPSLPTTATVTSYSVFRRPVETNGFSPTKRLAKSLPRTTYSDPLTGRVIDFSNPRAASPFPATAVMSLCPKSPPGRRIDHDPILAKTRVRNQVQDPITGEAYKVRVERPPVLPSLGHEDFLSPVRVKRQLSSPPIRNQNQSLDSISGIRKKKTQTLAYVSPYLLS